MILVPGTPRFSEIHQKCHVTGSTVSAAIGISKYKTRQQFVAEKRSGGSTKKAVTPYQQSILNYGTDNEKNGLSVASLIYANIQYPAPFAYLHDDNRYGATPDGLLNYVEGRSGVLEIKCPSTKLIYPELLLDDPYVPIEHFVQIMMELACHQRDVGVYVCWTPTETCIAHVYFDMDIWTTIYGYLLRFSLILCDELSDGKLLHGQKKLLQNEFIEYSKKACKIIFFISPI